MHYAIVIERADENYSAYMPDLPDCITTGKTPEEVETPIKEAIKFHVSGLQADGEPIPIPSSQVDYVEVLA